MEQAAGKAGRANRAAGKLGERSKQARRQARAKRERRSAEASKAASEASLQSRRGGQRSTSEQRGERVWNDASEASKFESMWCVWRLRVQTALRSVLYP